MRCNKALALALAAVTALVARTRPVRRVEVSGPSMRPTLEPGDRLLVVRTARPLRGELAVVADPRDPARSLVKRVAESRPGSVTLVGDNPASSTDSREFGPVPVGAVRGRVLYRYAPGSRTGWLGGISPRQRRGLAANGGRPRPE